MMIDQRFDAYRKATSKHGITQGLSASMVTRYFEGNLTRYFRSTHSWKVLKTDVHQKMVSVSRGTHMFVLIVGWNKWVGVSFAEIFASLQSASVLCYAYWCSCAVIAKYRYLRLLNLLHVLNFTTVGRNTVAQQCNRVCMACSAYWPIAVLGTDEPCVGKQGGHFGILPHGPTPTLLQHCRNM